MKKVGKTNRPFRYELNQIPYNYTVEVTNRFKGLDLIDRVPEELQTEVCDNVHEAVIKTIPKKKKCKKAKWLSEEALQIAMKRREAKGKGEMKRYIYLNAQFPKNSKECKEIVEKATAPHSSTLAWKTPWTEEPGGLQSMGSLRVRHD